MPVDKAKAFETFQSTCTDRMGLGCKGLGDYYVDAAQKAKAADTYRAGWSCPRQTGQVSWLIAGV
jgi:hypothetical protein